MANTPITPVSPAAGLTNETSSQPGLFDQSTSNLDSSNDNVDKVFEGIVKTISPKSIVSENEAILDAFVKLLTEESPISVNILDAYSKNRNIPSIINVQEQFANMYLNNFYYIWRKAKNDYKLKNSLDGILAKYNSLNTEAVTNNTLKFFDDEHSMYTAERYVLGKSFKEKKGTATAIEYAYKLAWLAGIEGPLRDAYHFDIKHETCLGFSKGFIICGDDAGTAPVIGGDWEDTRPGYPSLERPGTNTEGEHYVPSPIPTAPGPTNYDCNDIGVKRIATFSISDAANLDADACTPFSYEVEGSLLPEFFESFVMPLAHPVGFNYIYRKILEIAFIDYFNLEFIYLADNIGVKSLCPDGDCSSAINEIYGKRIEYDNAGNVIISGGGISGSSLRNFESGKIYFGEFRDYDYEKYILANGSYLISYTYAPPSGNTDRRINYFDVPLNRSNNIVYNSTFDSVNFWKGGEYNNAGVLIEDSIWNIVENKARVYDSGNNEDNRLTQEVSMIKDSAYVIEIEVFDLQDGDSVFIRINNNEQYDPDGNSWPTPLYDPIEYELTENILYTIDYIAKGKEKIEIYTKSINASFAVSNVRIIPNDPNRVYENHEHSTVYLKNGDIPYPLLYTHDIFNAGGENTSGWLGDNAEKMTSLYYDHNDEEDIEPTIGPLVGTSDAQFLPTLEYGNMIINEWHYGQSEFVTTGYSQVVNINEKQTVDYAVASSESGDGTLRTRYKAFRDMGSIDLNLENFLDVERWTVSLVNVDSLQEEETENITNQGGFVIGSIESIPKGVIIPWGHPSSAYIKDDLKIDSDNGIAIIDALNDDDFIDPLKWYSQTDWNIEEIIGQPTSNYAICKPNSDYATTGDTQNVTLAVGDLVDYDVEITGPPPGNGSNAPWGQIGLTYKSKKTGSYDLNTQDYIDDPLWEVYERSFSTSVYRSFDMVPEPGTFTYVRVEFEIQMDSRMEEKQDSFLEMRIGAVADYDYTVRINPDIIEADINTNQTVTYLTSSPAGDITSIVYEATTNLTGVNLKNGSSNQGSSYSDGGTWRVVPDGNAEDYSYIYYVASDKNVNVLDTETVDYKEILQDNKVITTRYKAVGNRGTINFKTENFASANWTEVEINKAIKYTSSGFKRWMGEWNGDNIIAFTASPRFKGNILSTKIEWLDNTAYIANPEDINYISMEEFTTNTNMTLQI